MTSVSPKLAEPSLPGQATPGIENIASTNPFATSTGELLTPNIALVDNVAASSPQVDNHSANTPSAMIPVPAVAAQSPVQDQRAAVTRTVAGRATQITLGSLPERQGAAVESGEAMSKSESLLPLWSRPLPAAPPPEEPGEQPEAASNPFWERLVGQTPIDQGKSLLALLAIVGIAARFVRTS